MSCKVDRVKGMEGNRQPIGMQTGTDRWVEKQSGAGHHESWHCAWSEELSPGLRLEPGACPHFLVL